MKSANHFGLFAVAVAGFIGLTIARADQKDIAPELYKAEVIVTGVQEPERTRGFRSGLTEIIIKLTGRPDLETSPKLVPFIEKAAEYIESFSYEDRKKGIPIHDEQGTRDRSFFLRMTTGGKLVEALKAEGIELWKDRPDFEVLLTVQDLRGSYIVAEEAPDGAFPPVSLSLDGGDYRVATMRYDGYGPRETLKSIARHRGLILALPDALQIEANENVQPPELLPRLFHGEPRGARETLRLRAALKPLASGYWQVETYGWSISPSDKSYIGLRDCFPQNRFETTLDGGLRESLDAISAFVREHGPAHFCEGGARR